MFTLALAVPGRAALPRLLLSWAERAFVRPFGRPKACPMEWTDEGPGATAARRLDEGEQPA